MKDLSDMEAKKGKPSWRDVKGALVDFDRAGLLALVQDMYAASKDNQVFLHARFGLGEDVLKPYKAAIDGCFGEGSCHVLNIRNYGAVPVTPDM